MSRTPVAPLLALCLCCSGCRCSPSEDQLPVSRTADPASVRVGCPSPPPWASSKGLSIEVDLQHVSMSHGTGYRLHSDGRLETYDDTDLVKDDAGKSRLARVPGRWRSRGVVPEEARAALRSLIANADPDKLVGRRTGKGDSTNVSHFVLTRDGKSRWFCYAGDQAPDDLLPIEQAIHDLVKRASDAGARD